MLVGYARVSTEQQNSDRQIDMLVKFGVNKRSIYKEEIIDSKLNREQFYKMVDKLQEGDVVVIADLTRVSRSIKDLLKIVDNINSKGAFIKSLQDTWLDTTIDNPYNDFLLTVIKGLSELERDIIIARTKEGLASAKARGRESGRPNKRNGKANIVKNLYKQGYKITYIAEKVELSRATIYRILKDK